MSADDSDAAADDEALATRLSEGYRTVTPPYLSRPNPGMNAMGWTGVALLLVLFVPFLPLVVLTWLLSKVVEFLADVPGED